MSDKLAQILLEIEQKTPIKDDNELKKVLNDIISRELKKSTKKMDENLITECVDLILEIDNVDFNKIKKNEKQLLNQILLKVKDFKTKSHILKIPRYAFPIPLIIVLFSLLTFTVMAFGSSIVDFGKNLFKFPEKTIVNSDSNDIFHTSDFRTYNSLQEMLKNENIIIEYPKLLPDNLEFTVFEVIDTGMFLDVKMKTENNLSSVILEIKIGANYVLEENVYKENGIAYNITEIEQGKYQAYWNNNTDYYILIANNEDLLHEIIKNF